MDAVDLDVCAALTDAPVAAGVLAPVKLIEAAVHTDDEHIQIRQEYGQLVAPAAELDDVLDDEVVARVGQRGQAAVEAGEQPRPYLAPPVERAVVASRRQHARRHELIGRHVQERLVERVPQRLRHRGLA